MSKSILDPVTHARLIAEIDEVAARAGIPARYIETSMTELCSEAEIDWVRRYPQLTRTGIFGLCYVGESPTQRMMSMAGAFTRNFVLARVATVNEVIEEAKEGRPPSASVLMIPTFHRSKQGGLTSFQLNTLWSILEQRMIDERQTVIAVQSIAQMKHDYGQHFADLVKNHYEQI